MADEAVTHRPQTTTIAMDAKPTKHTQTLALRKARCYSLNAKPYKHTQTIAVRKVSVTVRFWKGWWSDNPSVLTAEEFVA